MSSSRTYAVIADGLTILGVTLLTGDIYVGVCIGLAVGTGLECIRSVVMEKK